MSRAIRIVITVILACICQTDLVKYIRIATIAPDMSPGMKSVLRTTDTTRCLTITSRPCGHRLSGDEAGFKGAA